MSHTLNIVKIEAVDEFNDLSFVVETFDECTSVVTLKNQCFTLESWRATASDIEHAIKMLNLEVPQ